jgi:hypothetical protein
MAMRNREIHLCFRLALTAMIHDHEVLLHSGFGCEELAAALLDTRPYFGQGSIVCLPVALVIYLVWYIVRCNDTHHRVARKKSPAEHVKNARREV